MRFIRSALALLLLIDGLMIVLPTLISHSAYFSDFKGLISWAQIFDVIELLDIPRFLMGTLLIFFVLPVLFGIKIGWLFTSFVLAMIVAINFILEKNNSTVGLYSLFLLVLFIANWRVFNRHSLSAAGLVAFVSLAALLGFSILGALYLGDHFQPHITDISSAFYFTIISITTVGFGDIVPISVEARLFTVSIIVLGIAIFTTAAIYILGVVAKDTREIVKKRIFRMKDHYVIIGASPLALHTYNGLKKRDLNIMVLCTEDEKKNYPDDATVVTATRINKASLASVNLSVAKGYFALGPSDAENTLTVLAANEIIGKNIKSIVVVNDDQNYENMKLLHTDLLISLTSLGSEVLLKMLFSENIDNQIIEKILFADNILEN